jgi:hypothetical protein
MGVRWGRSRGFLIAAGVGSSLLITGCAGASQDAVLAKQAAKTAAHGFKVSVAVSEDVDGSTAIFHASGSFAAGLRSGLMSMDMRSPGFGSGGSMPIVIANGTIYEKLPEQLASMIPGGQPWLSVKLSNVGSLSLLPGLNNYIRETLVFANPAPYLGFIDAAGTGPARKLGKVTVNGVRTTHYRTQIKISRLLIEAPTPDPQAAQQLAHAVARRTPGAHAAVNVWIDGAGRVRQLRTSFKGIYAGHRVAVAISEAVTSYGPQPSPTAPNPASTTDLLSLVEAFQP